MAGGKFLSVEVPEKHANLDVFETPPRCLDQKSSVTLSSIGVSRNLVFASYAELRRLSIEYISSKKPSQSVRNAIFANAWAVIDRSYSFFLLFNLAIRKASPDVEVLASSNTAVTAFKKLESDYRQTIADMRNYTDHIHQRIGNIADATSKEPRLGEVGFISCVDPKRVEFKSHHLILGPVNDPSMSSTLTPPWRYAGKEFRPPVDHFSMRLRGMQFQLSEFVGAFASFVEPARIALLQTIIARLNDQGVTDLDSHLEHMGAGLDLVLTAEVQQTGSED